MHGWQACHHHQSSGSDNPLGKPSLGLLLPAEACDRLVGSPDLLTGLRGEEGVLGLVKPSPPVLRGAGVPGAEDSPEALSPEAAFCASLASLTASLPASLGAPRRTSWWCRARKMNRATSGLAQ